MKSIVKYLLILPLIAVTSCFREPFDDPCPCGDEKEVVLKLAIPYASPKGPVTRSIGAAQENAIETLDILAFKVADGVETFLYWAEAKKNVGNEEGNSLQSFNAKLRVKDDQQRFVLISNARSKVETLVGSRPSGGWEGVEKEAMLGQLTVDLDGGDRWKSISAANYTAIPMWGETAPAIISAATTSISSGAIPMLRMIAKVEVQLDKVVAGLTEKFQIKSVYVYNTNTSGRIVPKQGYTGVDMIATKASLPETVVSSVGPLDYTDFAYPGERDVAMRGAIYLFETEAKNAGNFLEETCLVVGGFYGEDQFETYYRLDFFASGGTTHLDILRNHRYICNIVDVKSQGLPTVDEAYHSKRFSMETNIIVWDDGKIHDFVFDNQYMLGVSHNPFELSWETHTVTSSENILRIMTDYPTGWTATVWDDKAGTIHSSWLNISHSYGAGGAQPDEIQLLTDANYGVDRLAYIHIKAGRLTYIVTVIQRQNDTAEGTITLSPKEWLLPNDLPRDRGGYVVQVDCRQPNGTDDPAAAWTLTSDNPAWLRLSLTPGIAFSSASTVLTGTGSQVVYLIPMNNTAMNPRTTTVYLGASSSDVAVNVMQYGNPAAITVNDGAGEAPKDAITYVGAFWRADQIGERIIRIDVGANKTNWGSWTASVMWMDPQWRNEGGIVLSAAKSSDPNLYTNNPGNAENFPVEGLETVITGDVINGYITFRIGLKKPHTPTASYPVRYAVVLLSYADNSKHQKIFIRQGHDADYLMRNGDPINSGGLTSRTVCKKFSPYNLTDGDKIFNRDIGIRGGKFVDFPTQAGAYFTWIHNPLTLAPNNRMRWAWKPYNIKSGDTWWGAGSAAFWNTLGADNETSPTGFRRVNDGAIDKKESGANISNSEIRQSLFNNPKNTWNNAGNDFSNSVIGYYADGFFDRRPIVSSENGTANSTVAVGTADVAYIGRLFFNPRESSESYNASLFFPFSGHRKYENATVGGDLTFTGSMGSYWTCTRDDAAADPNSVSDMRISATDAALWRSGSCSWGYTIRPVAE